MANRDSEFKSDYMETNIFKIIVLVCIISTTAPANVGESCDQTRSCVPDKETCIGGICNCSTGYINVGGKCETIPQKPEELTASNIYSKQMTLSWAFSDPSPGNTIYTINVYQATDDKGTEFILTKFLKTLGFDSKSVSVTGLEEYWPYRFKVIATTGKGNSTSDFSSTFRTKSGRPGKVLDLHVTTYDYERAYVTWRLPDLKDHNGILQNYRYLRNKTGVIFK